MRNGRPIINTFEPKEKLYFRFPPPQGGPLGDRLPAASIRFPDMSVNRSGYGELRLSEPRDVIIGFPGWGVATFRVEDIPGPMRTDERTTYEFRAEHVPEEDNYSHSEVRTFKNGTHHRKIEPPSTVKKKYRTILMERTKIEIEPGMAAR